MNRSVRVIAISISEDLAREARFVHYLVANGACVENLAFYGISAASTWQKGALEVVSVQCPNVIEVAFDNYLTLDDCSTVVNAWPQLEDIALPDCGCDVRSSVAAGLRNLTAVTVKGQRKDRSDAWNLFCETVTPSLQYFNTYEEISDEALLALVVRCHELHTLKLHRSGNDELLTALAGNCPLLEELDMHSLELSTSALISLGLGCKKLTALSMVIPSSAVLEHYPALRTLTLIVNQSTAHVLLDVSRFCPLLEELTVLPTGTDTADCSEAVVALGKRCPHLRHLLLSLMPPTDALLVAIGQHFPNLNALAVAPDSTDAVTDVGVCVLAQGCSKLRALLWTLSGSVTMLGVAALATHCPRLYKLKISAALAKQYVDSNLQLLHHHLKVSVA
jgi:hypothetical protein